MRRQAFQCANPACRREIPMPFVRPDGEIAIAAMQAHMHNIGLLVLERHVRVSGQCRACNRPIVPILIVIVRQAVSSSDPATE